MKILPAKGLNSVYFNAKKAKKQTKTDSVSKISYSPLTKSDKSHNFNFQSISFGKILSADDENFDKELSLSTLARKFNIDTPEISQQRTYVITGEQADYEANPIKKGHIENVLKNLKLMDENNLFHGDIEKGHVFYDKHSNKVEFDCFKFGCMMNDESSKGWMEWEFPKTIHPTNIMQYENNCIGEYLTQIEDEDNKNEFLKIYTKEASKFHKKRSEHLSKTNQNKEQIQYEKEKSIAYENADDVVIDFLKNRIELKFNERIAFTQIDEGRGACGHKKDEELVIKGIKGYLDLIDSTLDYIDMSQKSINNPKTSIETKNFLKGELNYINHWLNNYIISTKGNALYSLNPKNEDNKSHKNISEEKRNDLKNLFSQMQKTTDIQEKSSLNQEIKKLYEELIEI